MTKGISMAATGSSGDTVEGIARVVQAKDGVIWLEPEQTTSCGACAAAGQCGSKGIGSLASRIEARRFVLHGQQDFGVGERIVIGVGAQTLLKGALIAYGLPLASSLIAGGAVQAFGGGDVESMAGAAAGLAVGLLLAGFGARRLSARGELAPRFLRRAQPGESCSGKDEA